jgi:hypothetical protein
MRSPTAPVGSAILRVTPRTGYVVRHDGGRKMKRRRVAVLALSGCLALAGLLAFWLWPRGSCLNREHFAAVRVGMTRAEVEQVLGGPPRNECRGPVDVWVRREGGVQSAGLDPGTPTVRFFPDVAGGGQEGVWVGEAGLLAARFGDDGRLREKYVSDVVVIESPWSNLPAAVYRRFWR